MKLTETPTPSYELVRWACAFADDPQFPADRPWYLAPPPPWDVSSWENLCHCGKQPVRVQRYPCDDGVRCVYLGQCSRCQSVIWTFREA
jgi:hypothetical protein